MTKLLLLVLAYFATAWLGLQIPFVGSHITLVWLPTGIAVAALLRWGRGMWPGIYLAAFLINFSIAPSVWLAAGIAIGNTLGPLLCVALLEARSFHETFHRQRDVRSLLLAAALGMLVSASGGVASLYLAGLMPLASMGFAWLSWWMGDLIGVLLAAPALLTLSWAGIRKLRGSGSELLLWCLVASGVAWMAFGQDFGSSGHSLPLAFLTLPLFAWAALRFGNLVATLAALLFSILAALGTASGHGTFFLPSMRISLFLLWCYMALTVLTGLFITALELERERVEGALRENEKKLRGLFELSPLGIVLTDMHGRYLEFNRAFEEICGYSAKELATLSYWALTPGEYAEDEARQLELLVSTGRYGPYEKEYIRKDGSRVPLRLNGVLITCDDGQQYIWSLVEDISDQKRIAADLKIAATAFDAQVGIIVTDSSGVILKVNQAFVDANGYSAEEMVGQTPRLLKSGRHDAAFYAAMWEQIRRTGVWEGEIWDRRKNGEIYPKWLTITELKGKNGEPNYCIGTEIDITQRKAAEEEAKHLAFYDQLTGLPNRRHLLDRLSMALLNGRRSQQKGALLLIDLDSFKTLNDSLGHDHGDLLLQQVSQRLVSSLREEDMVARLGGDEFVVMLELTAQSISEAASTAERVGEKIRQALNRPYLLNAHEYHGTASIGVTLFGSQYSNLDDLLKQADLALYRAKASGRNALRFFDPEMQAAVNKKAALEMDLHVAVRLEQIVPYLQAQVDGDGRPTGAEVLMRWQHPQKGLILPDDFIHLVEDNGLIVPLGRKMLEFACRQLRAWAEQPATAHLTLAVNVSTKQLHHSDFVRDVKALLAGGKVSPKRLKLELTESVLMQDVEHTIIQMQALDSIGVCFALDDFGTGYSSLAYLKRLPLEKLKIDRSFVADILDNPNDAAIARTIVALALSMELEVIAEGVETEAQRQFLAQLGCHAYQGFLFGEPLPIEAFEAQYLGR